jgi:outer membrane protein TolC
MRFQNPFVTLTISTLLTLGLINASPAKAEAVASPAGSSTDKDQAKPGATPAVSPTVVPPTHVPPTQPEAKGRLRPILPVQSKPAEPQPDLVIPDDALLNVDALSPSAPVAQNTPEPAPSSIPAPTTPAEPAEATPAAPAAPAEQTAEPESDRDRQRRERQAEKERRRQERAAEREERDRQRATEREERDRQRAEERRQRDEEKERDDDEKPEERSAPTTGNSEEPAVRDLNGIPDFLNPNPNPLSVPTTAGEVEISGTQPITLQQAIDLALRNSPELRSSRLEVDQSRAQLSETQAQQNSPTLDLSSGLTFNVQEGRDLEVSVVPSSAGNPGGTTSDFNGNRFGSSLNANVGLDFNYALFTFGRRAAAIGAAQGRVRFQELKLEADTEQLVLDVTTDYYDLQQADKEVLISQDSLKQADQSLRDAQALERAGVGTRFDVLQAQVDVANAKQQLTQDLSQQEIARRRLVQRLNVAQTITLASAEDVAVAGSWDLSLPESIVEAIKNRAELEQQLVQRDVGEQQRRSALASRRPQVGFRAQYGLSGDLYSTQGDASNPSVVESRDANDGRFFDSLQVGLTFSMRLSDGGVARSQARQAQVSVETAESQFENVKTQIRRQVEEAHSTLISSQENIETTALAVTSANEALRLARLRFQAGVGTQSDVLRSQTELTRSRVNNLNAILNYNRALATLKRSVSNLPDGNLADTP